MSETIVLDEFETQLHKIVLAAHCGDEQAMDSLDTLKEWLKNN